ncbi:MAG: GNAT family N-acetyltransferase [Candidatus Devosia symbiotica]|nr:GNAT family N-acetyltransferase [Candidatus Devosia symbiotica]
MDQLSDLVRLHGDPAITRYLTVEGSAWSEAQAVAELTEWIALFDTRRLGKLWVTRKSDGAMIGRAGFSIYPPTGEPELGYALFTVYHGQGYATEAAMGLRD